MSNAALARQMRFPIRGRFILSLWLIPIFFPLGLNSLYLFTVNRWNLVDPYFYWWNALYYVYFHFIVLAAMSAIIYWSRIRWKQFFVPIKLTDFQLGLAVTAWVFCFSFALLYLIYYPLSFLLPEFVKDWLINLPPLIYWSDDHYPIMPNSINFLSLVLFAPVLEELLFRGLLLRRWAEKYGVKTAVLLSSFFFGIVHPDGVSAFAFGLAMCYLYIRSGTLLLPMICHAIYNLVVWTMHAGYIVHYGPEFLYTLQDFQNGWLWGVASFILCAPWIVRIAFRLKYMHQWELPRW